jgi:hypothetical protein
MCRLHCLARVFGCILAIVLLFLWHLRMNSYLFRSKKVRITCMQTDDGSCPQQRAHWFPGEVRWHDIVD